MKKIDQNIVTLNVISSGAFYDVITKMIKPFQDQYKININLSSGSSMGESETSIPHRLKRHEKFDIVILAEKEMQILISQDYIRADMHAKLVFSSIGAMVPYGVIPPNLSTEDAAIDILLNANRIGYSASMSGTHLSTTIFPNLAPNIYAAIKPKLYKVIGNRVAEKVADGTCDIGFQEISEIIPFTHQDHGIQLVTPIPDEWQQINIFSIGIVKTSKYLDAAKQLIAYLQSSDANQVIASEGLLPVINTFAMP